VKVRKKHQLERGEVHRSEKTISKMDRGAGGERGYAMRDWCPLKVREGKGPRREKWGGYWGSAATVRAKKTGAVGKKGIQEEEWKGRKRQATEREQTLRTKKGKTTEGERKKSVGLS